MNSFASRKRNKGAAMVEFAVIVPILLVLSLGLLELGRALYQHTSLGKGADTAARYMSRAWGAVSPDCVEQDAWGAAVLIGQNLASFGNEAGSGDPIVKGLTAGDVSIVLLDPASVSGSDDLACIVRVESSVNFQGVFGERVVPFMDLGPIRLSASREMRYVGE